MSKEYCDNNKFCCPICLNPIAKITGLNCCNHKYCYECIIRWRKINSSCPQCRRKISSIKKLKYYYN